METAAEEEKIPSYDEKYDCCAVGQAPDCVDQVGFQPNQIYVRLVVEKSRGMIRYYPQSNVFDGRDAISEEIEDWRAVHVS